jgi:hypothetical protein
MIEITNGRLTSKSTAGADAIIRRQDMAPRERMTAGAPVDAAGVEQRKRGLTPEGLIQTEATLRQSVDGMTQAVADFEKLSALAFELARQGTTRAPASPSVVSRA